MVETITPQSEDTDKNPDSAKEVFEDKLNSLKLIVTTSEILEDYQKDDILRVIDKHAPQYISDRPQFFYSNLESDLRYYADVQRRELLDFRKSDNLASFISDFTRSLKDTFSVKKAETTPKVTPLERKDSAEESEPENLPKAA